MKMGGEGAKGENKRHLQWFLSWQLPLLSSASVAWLSAGLHCVLLLAAGGATG
jgi:hypothetical protein